MDFGNFDYREVEIEEKSFLIPKGQYKGTLTEVEYKSNKAGNGTFFEMNFQITDGQYAGRDLKKWVTWEHATSDMAVKIGRETMAKLCKAVANDKPVKSPEELIGKPVTLTINIKVRKDTGDETNDITYFSAAEKAGTRKKPEKVAPFKAAAKKMEIEVEDDIPY